MVHMLRGVLSVGCVSDGVKSSVGNKVPTSFRFVGEEHVATIFKSEPSLHFLGKIPHLIRGLFMEPMVEWAVEVIGMHIDLLGKLTFKSREDIVEGKGVGCKMDPF
jgi:hypothetical protein